MRPEHLDCRVKSDLTNLTDGLEMGVSMGLPQQLVGLFQFEKHRCFQMFCTPLFQETSKCLEYGSSSQNLLRHAGGSFFKSIWGAQIVVVKQTPLFVELNSKNGILKTGCLSFFPRNVDILETSFGWTDTYYVANVFGAGLESGCSP